MEKISSNQMHFITIITLILIYGFLTGCNSDNTEIPSSTTTTVAGNSQSAPNFDDMTLIGKIVLQSSRQQLSSGNTQNATANDEELFPENVNGQVKITGTDPQVTLLVAQKYLDDDPNTLPDSIFILLVDEASAANNGDISFTGEILQVQKSLITNIKQAITSQSYEITQATVDTNKVTGSQDIPFTFTFHRLNNDYWQPDIEDDYNFDASRQVAIEGTEYKLLALTNDLDAQNLSEEVRVFAFRILSTSVVTSIRVDGEFLRVPKSVIADMKTALNLNPNGTVIRNNNTWQSLASFKLTVSLSLLQL